MLSASKAAPVQFETLVAPPDGWVEEYPTVELKLSSWAEAMDRQPAAIKNAAAALPGEGHFPSLKCDTSESFCHDERVMPHDASFPAPAEGRDCWFIEFLGFWIFGAGKRNRFSAPESVRPEDFPVQTAHLRCTDHQCEPKGFLLRQQKVVEHGKQLRRLPRLPSSFVMAALEGCGFHSDRP